MSRVVLGHQIERSIRTDLTLPTNIGPNDHRRHAEHLGDHELDNSSGVELSTFEVKDGKVAAGKFRDVDVSDLCCELLPRLELIVAGLALEPLGRLLALRKGQVEAPAALFEDGQLEVDILGYLVDQEQPPRIVAAVDDLRCRLGRPILGDLCCGRLLRPRVGHEHR